MRYTRRMVIAGIDEAGYGPLLGPLVVGCCAFEVDGDDLDPLADAKSWPCLWKRLRRYVSRNRSKTGRKLHVNPSSESFVNDAQADAMLTRKYRKGFEVPAVV